MPTPEQLEICFYCLRPSLQVEHDHFPVPFAQGGKATVPACLECHTLKDRVPFGNWEAGLLPAVLEDMKTVSRETRIFLAKMLRLHYETKGRTQ